MRGEGILCHNEFIRPQCELFNFSSSKLSEIPKKKESGVDARLLPKRKVKKSPVYRIQAVE